MASPPPTGGEKWSSAMLPLGTRIAIELRQGMLNQDSTPGAKAYTFLISVDEEATLTVLARR